MAVDKLPAYIWEKVPLQTKGISRDTLVYEERLEWRDYERIKSNLLDVNCWINHTGIARTKFTLRNGAGVLVERMARPNDYILIEFPQVPFSQQIKLRDWVEITKVEEKITEEEAYFILELKPASCPTHQNECIHHFFTEDASNTFIIYYSNNQISVSIHGRNEYPNIEVKRKKIALRNFLFANLGLFGVNKILWSNMANGLLNDNKSGKD